MAKINPKSYTYILAIFFGLGGLIYINLIDESDELDFKNALDSGKKEVYAGKLKSLELDGLRDKLTFYGKEGSFKVFTVKEINTTNGLRPKDITPEKWYELIKIVDAPQIIDMHFSKEGYMVDEIQELNDQDRANIKDFLNDEKIIDQILSVCSVVVLLFSVFKLYKYQSVKAN